ncbi:leucine-rich repeat extensin-like protein 5 [Portunus trituberculatus]|uniref:leucine-rich repeat extensin-like protein 5 n=1 Tax=Portunus trituberculatus TaxID=210409 RepID=UPI001E1CF302|nr:leucine-rich repeat extensin-like protein 5 [Portunus trituberculatus]
MVCSCCAALEGVRLSVTPTTPPTPTPSQAAPYWMRPAPPDPPTDTSGGAPGEEGTEGPGSTHTPAPLGATRGLQETQVPGGAPHTVFPQPLPQETPAPPASPSPTLATQTLGATAGPALRAATVKQVTSGAAVAGTEAPQGAELGDSSSSRKTQVTSRPGFSNGLAGRPPPASSPDHSPAIKASSGPPVTPLTPRTLAPAGSPPPNWANGRLGTSSGNPGHSPPPRSPALPPPSPIDTSQTDRAQLARIWSAGEDDQWAGGGRRDGLRQRPPWAWTKGRRRRRKLPGEPSPPLSDLPPVPALPRAPAQTPSRPGRVESSSHDSIGGGSDARVPMSVVQAAPQPGGGEGAGRYEVQRPGGGHIDFKVTETGEFDGFSVTRTEEVDDAPSAPHQASGSGADVTRGEAASDRHDSPGGEWQVSWGHPTP